MRLMLIAMLALPSFVFDAPLSSAVQKAPAPRVIRLTANDAMTFSVTTITTRPNEPLQVVLRVIGNQPAAMMSHNFVLLQATADVPRFVLAAGRARDDDYIPRTASTVVLAATGLAGAGETVTVTFRAPAAPGAYPFLCSFPGHFSAGMKGTLIVRP